MSTTYSIQILDKDDKSVGELMTATSTDILKYIHKGFHVIDKNSNVELTEEIINSGIGVSDGVIDISC